MVNDTIPKECEKCGSKIVDGKCSCGDWYEKDKAPAFAQLVETTLLAYDFLCTTEKCDAPISGDHHNGSCIVLFKGDFDMCSKVKSFIKELTNQETGINT